MWHAAYTGLAGTWSPCRFVPGYHSYDWTMGVRPAVHGQYHRYGGTRGSVNGNQGVS